MTAFSRSPDRLYDLLPAFHRNRDATQGYPLRALLRVLNTQAGVIEDDIAQLYDDWFIETCADWVVPYIGDLVGYRPVHEAGEPGDPASIEGRLRNSFLISRREVANTIALRRRKGTLHVLEQLAADVAGWPSRAVEFYRLLAWSQHLDHQHPHRGRTIDLRDAEALDRLDGPFDRNAHWVDVRRIDSARRIGRHNIPSVGVFAFRLKSYPVSGAQACCLEQEGPHCYSFSALGNDAPLYTNPQADGVEPTGELGLPVPIRRVALQRIVGRHPLMTEASSDYCGDQRSFSIHAPDWPKKGAAQPIVATRIVAADLADWRYKPRRDWVAVDPVLGRIAFPPDQLPKKGVWVVYHYGFSADIGGGEYARPILQPSLAEMSRFRGLDFLDLAALVQRFQKPKDLLSQYVRNGFDADTQNAVDAWHPPAAVPDALRDVLIVALDRLLADEAFYAEDRFQGITLCDEAKRLLQGNPTGAARQRFNRVWLECAYAPLIAKSYALYRVDPASPTPLGHALKRWGKDKPRYAIIEFVDSRVYTEPIKIELEPYQTLQIRAAERTRPVLRMLDYMTDQPDAFSITGGPGSRFVLDGLLVSGRGVEVVGPPSNAEEGKPAPGDICEIVIRHCTLVPGWGLQCDCEPRRPSEPSIELIDTTAKLRIEHSILGAITITADSARAEPNSVDISDSIVDATHSGRVAVGAPGDQLAFATLILRRLTVLGVIRAHAIELAENSLFMGCVHVARSQQGCMRFCWVPAAISHTPRRYHCQPDLAVAEVAIDDPTLTGDALAAAKENEVLRVRPHFNSLRYGNPEYCQLAFDCAGEIRRGADDESEMGVFHDLFQPQREANLRARLAEYTPAGMDAGVLFAS